jgi:hypothetical protein
MARYRCDGCGMRQTAINDISGQAHTRTGGRPSRCPGRWWPEETRQQDDQEEGGALGRLIA